MNKGLRQATLWWQSPGIAQQSQGDHALLANHIDSELSSPMGRFCFTQVGVLGSNRLAYHKAYPEHY